MESSGILGFIEECSGTSSKESGWTTYIASPIQENHHHHDDDDHSNDKQADCKKGNYNKVDDGTESDDSMASDASSGPSHHEFPSKINEISVDTGPSKHAITKYSSKEKLGKQFKQSEGESPRIKLGREIGSAASDGHGGAKAYRDAK
ncbi:protein SOB FIVE-LIKE 4-like [Hevea brasiliensis]|uniref:protein SOB FIVE-LIKE 4-like n=1 Tax=Hevea brasiliensis TaxID=3981 RepID=UPI0025E7951C|nr:protein SOB FIVE-LIKE 4-like [Hevea brasiliensis]